jgi:two-component system, OmpR family, response regulator
MRVLVIEDNYDIAVSIRSMLERRKFSVDVASDGDSGLEHLLRDVYDVAVVDIVLPKRDGFSLCRAAREHGVETPMLMLTARDAVEDRVLGLDSGADDYLVKPFVDEELAARLRALLRRGKVPTRSSLIAGDLSIDVGARTASFRGKPLPLGGTEFRLLEFLARNVGLTFTRAQILEHVWDYDFDGPSNIVDVYVSQLRKKLAARGGKGIIVTVWGVGYKLTT